TRRASSSTSPTASTTWTARTPASPPATDGAAACPPTWPGPTPGAAGTSCPPAAATCRGRRASGRSTTSAMRARSPSSGRTRAWTGCTARRNPSPTSARSTPSPRRPPPSTPPSPPGDAVPPGRRPQGRRPGGTTAFGTPAGRATSARRRRAADGRKTGISGFRAPTRHVTSYSEVGGWPLSRVWPRPVWWARSRELCRGNGRLLFRRSGQFPIPRESRPIKGRSLFLLRNQDVPGSVPEPGRFEDRGQAGGVGRARMVLDQAGDTAGHLREAREVGACHADVRQGRGDADVGEEPVEPGEEHVRGLGVRGAGHVEPAHPGEGGQPVADGVPGRVQ